MNQKFLVEISWDYSTVAPPDILNVLRQSYPDITFSVRAIAVSVPPNSTFRIDASPHFSATNPQDTQRPQGGPTNV